jgi:4-carboxymuconolactone decarboxylase
VEWAIHAPIALREGIAAETIAAIAEGRRPAALNAEEGAVYDFCSELHAHKAVSDATWDAAVRCFGEQGTVDLVGINGYYTLLSMVMNTARTPAPVTSAPSLLPL